MLQENGFELEIFRAFFALPKVFKEKLLALIKRTAVGLHLIPKTMEGKELLKRIFFGKLLPLPPEIHDGMAEYKAPVPIPNDSPNYEYKVIYAVARV